MVVLCIWWQVRLSDILGIHTNDRNTTYVSLTVMFSQGTGLLLLLRCTATSTHHEYLKIFRQVLWDRYSSIHTGAPKTPEQPIGIHHTSLQIPIAPHTRYFVYVISKFSQAQSPMTIGTSCTSSNTCTSYVYTNLVKRMSLAVSGTYPPKPNSAGWLGFPFPDLKCLSLGIIYTSE